MFFMSLLPSVQVSTLEMSSPLLYNVMIHVIAVVAGSRGIALALAKIGKRPDFSRFIFSKSQIPIAKCREFENAKFCLEV